MLKVNTKKIKITELKPNKWNPKLKPSEDLDVEQQYNEVVNSVKHYGLIDPILVRSKRNGKDLGYYEIINGYHRFLACQELKFTEVIINDLGDVSDLQAKKLTIVTEEIKIPVDQTKLSELLKEMIDSEQLDKLAEGLPYSKELIQSKVELLNFDWEGVNKPELEPETLEKGIPTEGINTSLSLYFDNEQDKLLVESMFETMKNNQKAKTIPEALVLFAKAYGERKK